MKNILIVEDEKSIMNVLREVFIENGYNVETAVDGIDGFYLFQQKKIDLIITDIMMPKLNGGSFIEMIRKQDDLVPIIAITAYSSEEKALEILSVGADDFIAKPFSIPLLLQKSINLIDKNTNLKTIENSDVELELNRRFDDAKKTYDDGIQRYMLTSKEYEILKILFQKANTVVSREYILNEIWDGINSNNTRNVDNHIRNIRKRIPGIKIQTFSKKGYKFVL